jgi:hypothetical protein
MTDTAKEREALQRKLAASERIGDGYKARIAAIRKRLDELDMREAQS